MWSASSVAVATVDRAFFKDEQGVRTYESYEGQVRVHLAPTLGDYQLGALTPEQAAQLLDAMASERERPGDRTRSRTVRIRVTNSAANSRKVNLTATLPVYLVEVSLRHPRTAQQRRPNAHGYGR